MLRGNLNSYQKAFLLCLSIVILAYALLKMPIDDGLRHVGVAFSNFTSWGDVYPFSRFEDFKDYDPWYGYDKCLHWAATLFKMLPIPDLVSKLILIKILSIIFPALLLYLVLKRSGLTARINDKTTFALVLILMLTFLMPLFQRTAIARPFIFGTMFLLYSIGQRGFIKGVVSSAMLTIFYPYLSWFYILPVAFAHFMVGDKRYSMGAVSFLIPFLILQSSTFWGFQAALFQSDMTRAALNLKIGEFTLTLKTFFFYYCLVPFAILYPGFSGKVKSLNYVNLLILIYMLPSLKYVRYFIDIISPLIFIGFGNEILERVHGPFSELLLSWKMIAQTNWKKIRHLLKGSILKASYLLRMPKNNMNAKEGGEEQFKNDVIRPAEGRSVKLLIIVFYLMLSVMIFLINRDYYKKFKEFAQVLEPVPQGSTILLPFNQQYKTLFLRPDLHLIPSCEIGFPKAEIIKEYKQFFSNGILLPLAKKTGAGYFLESGDIYINPEQGRALELINENGEIKLWMIKG